MLLLYMPPIKDIDGFTYVDVNNVDYSLIEKNKKLWEKLTSKFISKMKKTHNISVAKLNEMLNKKEVIEKAIGYFKEIHEHGKKGGVKKKSRRRKKKKRAKKTKRRYKGGDREMEGVATLFIAIIGVACTLTGIGILWDAACARLAGTNTNPTITPTPNQHQTITDGWSEEKTPDSQHQQQQSIIDDWGEQKN
jgi:hypothetical protein